jgi:hypothetical protein
VVLSGGNVDPATLARILLDAECWPLLANLLLDFQMRAAPFGEPLAAAR